VEVRIDGPALLSAMRYAVEKRRGAACGAIFTAGLPGGVGEEKYSARARAGRVGSRYSLGLPGYRLQGYQAMLGGPVPAATPWEQIEVGGDCAYQVFVQRERAAAQGVLRLHDDTAVRLLSLIADTRDVVAAAQAQGVSTTTERPGMPTTALVVKVGEHTAIVSSSSRRHAGETLPGLLDTREAGLVKPRALSDALSSHEVAEAARLIRWHCLAHSRRKFSDLEEVLPHAGQVGRAMLRQVFEHDEQARQEPRGPAARLVSHPTQSQLLMDELKRWRDTQSADHLVAPNRALGQAIGYLQRHWGTLTPCLSVPGAALDHPLAAHALKLFRRQRHHALFDKSTPRASIASVLTSRIATGLSAGVNAVESLVARQEPRREVWADPAAWRLWA